jgi:YVTN family beta-propeller protein
MIFSGAHAHRVGRLVLGIGLLTGLVFLAPLLNAAVTGKPVIVQTNSAGDSVTLIDPSTDKIIAEIPGEEVAHGAAAAPDGSRFYFTNESTATLDVVDATTLKMIKKIPLTGPPNNLAMRKDGLRLYAAITGNNGGIDIIDTVKLDKIKFVRVLGGVHNPIITPDSKFVVAGSVGAAVSTVIDTQLERAIWSIHYGDGEGVRVFCFDWNPDGSTKRMFVQLSNLHGFAIVDWEKRKEVGRIMLPELPPAERNSEGIQGAPAHGILVSPDEKTLWSTSKVNSYVYAYSLPDLKYLGGVKVGWVPDWITFTPDSKKLYVANANDNTVSVIDVAARKEITRIKVGQIPKRNITAILPAFPSTN